MNPFEIKTQNGSTDLELNSHNDNTARLTNEATKEMTRYRDQVANWMWQQKYNAQYINSFINIKMHQVILRLYLLRLYDNIMYNLLLY